MAREGSSRLSRRSRAWCLRSSALSLASGVALAWLLGRPGITAPIVGASKPHHLQDAVAALSLRLDAGEVAALEEPYLPHAVAGFG